MPYFLFQATTDGVQFVKKVHALWEKHGVFDAATLGRIGDAISRAVDADDAYVPLPYACADAVAGSRAGPIVSPIAGPSMGPPIASSMPAPVVSGLYAPPLSRPPQLPMPMPMPYIPARTVLSTAYVPGGAKIDHGAYVSAADTKSKYKPASPCVYNPNGQFGQGSGHAYPLPASSTSSYKPLLPSSREWLRKNGAGIRAP